MALKRLLGAVPPELRLATALAGLLVGILFLQQSIAPAHAAGLRYVATNGADSGDCRNNSAPCATPQYAVDVATSGDEIRLATGTYTQVHRRAGITQTVYLSKTLTIRGGYTTSNWDIPDSVAHPTTLDAQGRGRVLYITGNISPTIEGLRLIHGDATAAGELYSSDESGGGVYSITATTILRNNWILANRARGSGGVSILFGVAQIDRNTIAQNTSMFGGSSGGVGLVLSTAILDSNRIISNTTISGRPAPSNGGGVWMFGSTGTFTSNIITGNSAFFTGGGVYAQESTISMTGNMIADNQTTSNIGNGGGVFLRSSTGTVINNTIADNFSGGAAGGVGILSSSTLSLKGNTIIGNSATSGGGIYLTLSDNILDSNLIMQNRAINGGGMRLGYSSPRVINTVIIDNNADNGSGVYLDNGVSHFIQTTIARNTASSGSGGNGIYIRMANGYTATLMLTNTILVGHTVGISITTGVTATVNNVLWFGNGSNLSSEGITTITGIVTGNPVFAPDGYHLTTCSAARGRGRGTEVTTDIDGDPRPNTAIDLGADQFVLSGTTCNKVYLPVIERALTITHAY